MTRRSVLFSPGDHPDKLDTAAVSDADLIGFDLEDGVAPDRKAAGREAVVDALAVDTASEVRVRIDPVGMGGGTDLVALVDAPTPESLVLPKVSAPGEIETVGQLCTECGVDCPIIALIETAAGVLAADRIAAVDRQGQGVIEVDGEMVNASQRRQAERIVDLAAAADSA